MRERARDRWPDVLTGLGGRHVVAFSSCADCVTAGGRVLRWVAGGAEPDAAIERRYFPGTWCAYGDTPLCLAHALERARGPA